MRQAILTLKSIPRPFVQRYIMMVLSFALGLIACTVML
jgi:hypothetical protein